MKTSCREKVGLVRVLVGVLNNLLTALNDNARGACRCHSFFLLVVSIPQLPSSLSLSKTKTVESNSYCANPVLTILLKHSPLLKKAEKAVFPLSGIASNTLRVKQINADRQCPYLHLNLSERETHIPPIKMTTTSSKQTTHVRIILIFAIVTCELAEFGSVVHQPFSSSCRIS